MESWFAVWTRSQYEVRVADALRQRDFEVFLPRVSVPSRRRDRRCILERPLIPGYVFLRFEASRAAHVRAVSVDGVVRILGNGPDALYPIPDVEVEAVRRLVDDGTDVRTHPWGRVGDQVRIIAGPLAGLEGIVHAWRAQRATFVVGIDLLRRNVGVEVPCEALARL